jgi:hypothetical protein
MEKFIIPANVLRITSPNPYLVLRNLGLEYLQKSIFKANLGEPLKDQRSNPYELQNTEIAKNEGRSSQLGTPMFGVLFIKSGFYYDEEGIKIEYKGLLLECVLFEVSMSKNVVKTAIQGRAGTIKEFVSDGDYQISVKGVICSEIANKYPEQEIKALLEVLKSTASISIESDVLNNVFGIYDIVVEGWNMPRSAGFFNTQNYEISCISDMPIEIRLKEEDD